MRDVGSSTRTGRLGLPQLRDFAAQALRHYDLRNPRATLLAESFNTVFRVSSDGATHLLRIGPEHAIHQPGTARAEREWTDDLAGRGLPVPRVVPAADGAASVQIAFAGVPGSRECTLLTYRTGRTLPRPMDPADVAELATLSARLHDASPPIHVRPVGVLDGRTVLHFDVPDLLDDAPEPHRAVLRAARDRAQHALDALWADGSEPPRLIHSDLTPNNVVRDRGVLAAIDFQDLTWGHVEQDLANTLYGITRGVAVDDTLATFRSAYERIRPWPGLTRGLLDDLVAARRLELVDLALLRGRDDLHEYVARHADALRDHLDASRRS